MEKFISFVEIFRNIDPLLIESVLLGYGLCFESFSESYDIVNETINEIISGNCVLKHKNNSYYLECNTSKLGLLYIIISYRDARSGIDAEAITTNTIELRDGNMFLRMVKNDLDSVLTYMSMPGIKSVLAHELSHIVEVTHRGLSNFKSQRDTLDNNRYENDYHFHVNHKLEKFPNTSQILSKEYDGNKSAHDILRDVKSNDRYNELNYRNKQKVKRHIGAFLTNKKEDSDDVNT